MEKTIIHFIGDSHGCYGGTPYSVEKNNKDFNDCSIKCHPVGPVLMYNFGIKKGLYFDLKDLNSFTYTGHPVNDNDMVIFSLGEIDVRCHIKKNEVNGNYKEMIDNIVKNYFDAIKENISQYNNLYVGVYNVVPPQDLVTFGGGFPIIGTKEERIKYTLHMNKKIKEYCLVNNFLYIDIFEKYSNNNLLNIEYSIDKFNITDTVFLDEYFSNIINKIKINDFFTIIYPRFFKKQKCRTSHETLANYDNNVLIPGGAKGLYYTHINYHTIKNALLEIVNKNHKNYYTIVETGCSAHGTQSTLIWDNFVNHFDGKVISVDLNQGSVDKTNKLTSNKTKVVHSDSLKFLPSLTEKIDFLYLDSYDVVWTNPLPSAEHHLKEFNCVKHLFHTGTVILIDDTPCCPEWFDNGKDSHWYKVCKDTFDPEMCGKGSLVNKELEKMGAKKIMHQYQTLWVIN